MCVIKTGREAPASNGTPARQRAENAEGKMLKGHFQQELALGAGLIKILFSIFPDPYFF